MCFTSLRENVARRFSAAIISKAGTKARTLFFCLPSRQLNLKPRRSVYGIGTRSRAMVKAKKHELFCSAENFLLPLFFAVDIHNECSRIIFTSLVCWFMFAHSKNAKRLSRFDFIVNKSLSCHFNHSPTISFSVAEGINKYKNLSFFPWLAATNCIHESDLCMHFRLADLNATQTEIRYAWQW